MRTPFLLAFGLTALCSIACFEEFDDPTQAILKKPEIIAITLNPPEASPGDVVTATVHVADRRGKNTLLPAIWMIDSVPFADDMTGQSIQFVVPDFPDSAYAKEGYAPLLLSVAVAKSPDTTIEEIAANLDNMIDSEEVLFGMRTLSVSPNQVHNSNPAITHISTVIDNIATPIPAVASSTAANFDDQRFTAIENAISLPEDLEIQFKVVATPALSQNQLRYQWISTGGDFKGRRAAIEPWITPKYRVPTGEPTADTQTPNPRKDPNLYPVWVIVRDDGEPYHLGTTVAEFYIRITPAP